jgi:hypothetical protein
MSHYPIIYMYMCHYPIIHVSMSLLLYYVYMCMYVVGMKYRYAKQWGIHCVSAQWFHDSVEAGYSMPEADYDVDKEGQGGDGREEGGGEGASASGTTRKR